MIKMPEVFRGGTFGTPARLTYQTSTKTPSDAGVSETFSLPISFSGSIQPLKPTELQLKPEGQRTWVWWKLFTLQAIPLDSIVNDPAKRKCRVLSVADWESYKVYDIAEPGTIT